MGAVCLRGKIREAGKGFSGAKAIPGVARPPPGENRPGPGAPWCALAAPVLASGQAKSGQQTKKGIPACWVGGKPHSPAAGPVWWSVHPLGACPGQRSIHPLGEQSVGWFVQPMAGNPP